MLILYEVVIAAGEDPDNLLSQEVLGDTQAQVMTIAEAAAVGFSGLRPDPRGRELRFIACAPRDDQFIRRRLEASPAAASFHRHEVDVAPAGLPDRR